MSQTLLPDQATSSKADDPTWVFLPGITGQNTALRAVCDSDRHLVFDLPPVSFSGSAARHVARQLRESDVGPFIIIGYSYGALVALKLAKLLPEKCRGVVIVNPPKVDRGVWRRYGAPLRELARNLLLLAPKLRHGRAPKGIVSTGALESAWERKPDTFAAHRAAVSGAVKSLPLLCFRLLDVLGSDVAELAQQCLHPVLVLTSFGDEAEWAEVAHVETRGLPERAYFPLVSHLEACGQLLNQWLTPLAASAQCCPKSKLPVVVHADHESRGTPNDP